MPKAMNLDVGAAAARELARAIKATWIDRLPEVNAVLTVHNAAKESLAFRFQDNQIIMYFSAGGRVYAASVTPRSVRGGPEVALRVLLQYAGCTVSDTGRISVSMERGSQTRSLTELPNSGLVAYALENAWRFGDFIEFMDYVNDKYLTLSWSA